jgi:aspartokinase/homoserine dehydrogenase 1
MKFGGSSLASPSRIKLVSETIQEKLQEDRI